MTITEKAIEALQSGMLDTSDIEPYMDAILNALNKVREREKETDKTYKNIKNDYVNRRDVINTLIIKGQHNRRYKVNEEWELNCQEICEAINEVPGIKDPSSYAKGWKDGRKELFDDIEKLL